MKTSNKDLILKTLATRIMACIEKYEAIYLDVSLLLNITWVRHFERK